MNAVSERPLIGKERYELTEKIKQIPPSATVYALYRFSFEELHLYGYREFSKTLLQNFSLISRTAVNLSSTLHTLV